MTAFVPNLGYLVVYLQNPLALGSLIMCVLSLWYVGSSEEKPEAKRTKGSTEKTAAAAVQVA
jgi:signal peptidase